MADVATPDFDTVADRLYAGDPAEFVTERTAAAGAAKSAGDAELARRIRALRKPTAAAAFVNRLARADSPALRELAELGARLREAHEQLAGTRLRELAHRRADLLRQIRREGTGLSESVAREVEQTLEAIVADPELARIALAGRLTAKAHQEADQWLSLPVKENTRPRSSEKDRRPASAAKEQRQREQRQREEQRRRQAKASKARAEAERELVRAQRVAEQADARVTDLRERLTEAEDRAARAADELAKARSAFEKADQAVENPG
ncbi:hypothetical protein GCM10022222_69430 [Amycolatopsis ultiminotia]|uniref:Transposase n=1 Tax=Amycolatopsis ultiminotia TaxID=543629 RepID=A0ABP6XZH0_9PSEU